MKLWHANLLDGSRVKSQILDISWQFRCEELDIHRYIVLLKKDENLLGNLQDLRESMEISM